MAFLRPDADDVDGGWTTDAGGTSLFPAVDETTAIDTDYIQSPVNPSAATCRLSLGNPSGTPAEPFVLRYRIENVTGLSLRVRLVQGASTEIAAWNEATAASFTTIEHTLTTPQFVAITDFTNLFVEFTADTVDPTLKLDLDFTTGVLDSKVTLTRASTATHVNASGLIASAAIDAPRFDYDPATLTARGLLLEEQRTNDVLHSRDLTQAAWTKTNITAAKNQTGADGTANGASSLTATAANGTCLQAITAANAYRCQVAWVKRLTGSGGVNMTMDNGATWTAITVTSSWRPVFIIRQAIINPTVGFQLVTSGDAIAVDYVQNEVGEFPTSVILTTSAAATRAADIATITGTNFSSWFNGSVGTFAAEIEPAGFPSNSHASYNTLIYVSDAPGNDVQWLYWNYGGGTPLIAVTIYDNGADQGTLSTTTIPPSGVLFKTAWALALNDLAVCINGGTVLTDTVATPPNACDRMWIGAGWNNTTLAVCHFKRLRFYNVRKTDAELQALTAA